MTMTSSPAKPDGEAALMDALADTDEDERLLCDGAVETEY
jgi:hypothetical protein